MSNVKDINNNFCFQIGMFFNYFYKRYIYISNTHIINLGIPVDIDQITTKWTSLKNEKIN